MTVPLEGRLVLELGARTAAATCGGLLAQLGARVVAVEPRFAGMDGKWTDRAAAMVGKLSICLDESQPSDRVLLERLIGVADVVLLSTDMPGTFPATAGISRWTGERPRPQIVCDLTAFGHTGPLAGRAATELEVQAVGGIMAITGRADGPPLAVGVPILEASAALYGAAAVVAALRVQRLHGFGQRIDVSMFDAAVNALSSFLTAHFGGEAATRSGNAHALVSPWGSYPGKDGFIVICTVTSEQFRRICEVINQPSLASESRFASDSERRKNAGALDAIIAEWTIQHTVADAVTALSAVGVACGPIVDIADLPKEANIAHRGMLRSVSDPVSGSLRTMPASPLRSEPKVANPLDRIPEPDTDRERVIRELAARSATTRWTLRHSLASEPAIPSDIRPLSGLRVVEIGQYTLAPFACRQLSALGADVVKIEPPHGDALRRTRVGTTGTSQIFAMMNTDKRGLVLDLNKEGDRDGLHRLLAAADVLVENLRPGALAKFGISTSVLRERHPHLVYCSLSGFGADSAYPGRAALDTVVQAMSGLMSATKEHGMPFKAGISASDLAGGQFGLLAMLAGVEARALTGAAPHFDIAMQDATVWLSNVVSSVSDSHAEHCVVECSDGYALVQGPAAAIKEVSRRAAGERAELQVRLGHADLHAVPILTVAEVVEHPQTVARELLIVRSTANGDEQIVLNCPLKLSGTPARVERLMSDLGVDDASVAADLRLKDRR